MGDISGRPKAPSQQVVYVPQYIYQNTPSNDDGTNSPDDETQTPEQAAAQQRQKNLLSRSRSRIGTILTGFRGILSPVETDEKRKTLLGE